MAIPWHMLNDMEVQATPWLATQEVLWPCQTDIAEAYGLPGTTEGLQRIQNAVQRAITEGAAPTSLKPTRNNLALIRGKKGLVGGSYPKLCIGMIFGGHQTLKDDQGGVPAESLYVISFDSGFKSF